MKLCNRVLVKREIILQLTKSLYDRLSSGRTRDLRTIIVKRCRWDCKILVYKDKKGA